MEQYYHLNCNKCGYDYWSNDGFPNYCPHCGKLFDTLLEKCSAYHIRPDGVEICYGIKEIEECKCHGYKKYCNFY